MSPSLSAVTRPALRYHGGKWKLAPWILSHLPEHRCYVEAYGGAANILLRKPRSYAEIYNDLNEDLVSFFRVLRDPEASAILREQLRLTPFSRIEFENAYAPASTDIERARHAIIRAFMGFGSASFISAHRTGFRANSNRSGTTPAHDWANYPDALPALTERLRGVVIERRDALECMRRHDGEETLHYVDPPYVHATRTFKRTRAKTVYLYEMTDADHRAMAESVHDLRGMVVLSGYDCELYREVFGDWTRIDKSAFADGAKPRIESLWLNKSAAARLQQRLAL